MEEDDFAAFLAEIETTKPAAEADAVETGKRPREGGPSSPEKTNGEGAPVLKKAKVVVAAAKPQVYKPPQVEESRERHALQEEPVAPATTGPAGPSARPSYLPPAPAPPLQPYAAGPGQHMMNQYAQAPGQGAMAWQSQGGIPTPAPYSIANAGPVLQHGGGAAAGQQKKPKKIVRVGAGEKWDDPTLLEWPDNDFRLFCGDLGNDVGDEALTAAFKKYPSFVKGKVIREKHNGKTKGYGFVSFMDPFDGLKALREMNGKYIGSRPVKLKKSEWKERSIGQVKKKEHKRQKFLSQLGLA